MLGEEQLHLHLDVAMSSDQLSDVLAPPLGRPTLSAHTSHADLAPRWRCLAVARAGRRRAACGARSDSLGSSIVTFESKRQLNTDGLVKKMTDKHTHSTHTYVDADGHAP